MTNLEIAEKLREQIKAEWPYVSTILALYENNASNRFGQRIKQMVAKLLPDEVYYQMAQHEVTSLTTPILIENNKAPEQYFISVITIIESLPINIVLFSSEDNPEGKL